MYRFENNVVSNELVSIFMEPLEVWYSSSIGNQKQFLLFLSFLKTWTVAVALNVHCCLFSSPFCLFNGFTGKIPLHHRLTYTKDT